MRLIAVPAAGARRLSCFIKCDSRGMSEESPRSPTEPMATMSRTASRRGEESTSVRIHLVRHAVRRLVVAPCGDVAGRRTKRLVPVRRHRRLVSEDVVRVAHNIAVCVTRGDTGGRVWIVGGHRHEAHSPSSMSSCTSGCPDESSWLVTEVKRRAQLLCRCSLPNAQRAYSRRFELMVQPSIL